METQILNDTPETEYAMCVKEESTVTQGSLSWERRLAW